MLRRLVFTMHATKKHCMHICKQSDQVTTKCRTHRGNNGCLDALVPDAATAAVSSACSLLAFPVQTSDQSKPVDEFQI